MAEHASGSVDGGGRRPRRLLFLVVSAACTASLVAGPGTLASPKSAQESTVVIIEEQEPPNLQGLWVGSNLYAASQVLSNIWYGGQIRNDKGALVPRLFADKPRLVENDPPTIAVEYKDTAVWSDGRPVTVKDLRATWQVFVNPANNVISRTGWEDVKSITGNGKKGTVVFKRHFADWEPLVSSGPYPAHVIAGQDMNTMFLTSIGVSSGPWLFDSWQKGVQLTVRRNPRFKAFAPMKLDRVVFRFIRDTNARFQALKAGEGDVMEPQPQLQIADFLADPDFVVEQGVGYAWEHVDIQLGPKGHVALKQPYIRRALVTGINRPQIVSALYGTIAPALPVLQSLMFRPFEAAYKANFAVWKFNQQKVIDMLESKGCAGGPSKPSRSNQSIFRCPKVGRLSFRFSTTTGNQLRALAFEIMQRQLKSVGIELVARFQVAGTLFGTTLPSGDWDLIMFTWVGSPSSSITTKDVYGCGGDLNYGNYCNRRLSAVLDRVTVTPDEAGRARLLNDAERRFLVPNVPSIPLFARPLFVIHRATVKGPVANPTGNLTWNIGLWTA